MFFCPFSGWNPVILWSHLQEICEHGCCGSQLGKHTAVCGQSDLTPCSRPAMGADKCPSLQQGRSRFLSPKETVFLCLTALQLEIIKEQIRIIWWCLGKECFYIFASSLCLKGLCWAWRQLHAWSCARTESSLPSTVKQTSDFHCPNQESYLS